MLWFCLGEHPDFRDLLTGNAPKNGKHQEIYQSSLRLQEQGSALLQSEAFSQLWENLVIVLKFPGSLNYCIASKKVSESLQLAQRFPLDLC